MQTIDSDADSLRDFPAIEKRRAAAGISASALCGRAGIHATTYLRIKKGENAGRRQTLARLDAALTALVAEQAEAAE